MKQTSVLCLAIFAEESSLSSLKTCAEMRALGTKGIHADPLNFAPWDLDPFCSLLLGHEADYSAASSYFRKGKQPFCAKDVR